MSTFLNTITGENKIRLLFLIVGVCVVLVSTLKFAFATEPSPQERAADELPDVIREIERTQEYADRNGAAKERKKAITACIDSGNCEGF